MEGSKPRPNLRNSRRQSTSGESWGGARGRGRAPESGSQAKRVRCACLGAPSSGCGPGLPLPSLRGQSATAAPSSVRFSLCRRRPPLLPHPPSRDALASSGSEKVGFSQTPKRESLARWALSGSAGRSLEPNLRIPRMVQNIVISPILKRMTLTKIGT